MKKILALVLLWTSVAAFAQITYTDYSGSITTGGTSQTLAPASNGRVRIAILNPATETENLCVNLTVAASCTPGTSWILQSGQSVVIDSTEVVTVVAATTGHKWIAKAGVGAGFAANAGGSGGGGASTIADGADVNSGSTTDAAATVGGTGTLSAKQRLMTTQLGGVTETAPATDTASSGLNGRLQKIAQNLTTLNTSVNASNTQLPTALGSQAAATSLGVTASTEDIARVGIITETAPASDTASSGLNGRTQRIAQNISTLTLAQGSTTAGQKGILPLGAVTTAAPTYTTAQSSPLSLDTSGNLRVAGTFSNTSAGPLTPATATATNSTVVGATYNTTPPTWTNAQQGSLQVDSTGNLLVTEHDTLVINGSVTSAATLFSQDLTGYQGIIVQITSAGTSSTITYEASEDNTTWYSYPGFDVTNAVTAASATTTAVGIRAWSRKSRYFRARVSTYGSGTVTVVASLTKASVLTYLNTFIANSTLGIVGQSAHDSPVVLAPVRIGARARTAQYATTVVQDDVTDIMSDLSGAIITKPYSPSGTDWSYTAAASGIVNTTTAVTIKAAAAAGYRNYVQHCNVATDALGAATELVIRDGAAGAVIYRTKLQTAALPTTEINFVIPRKSTAATLLEAATLTAVTGGVYINCEGYEAQ